MATDQSFYAKLGRLSAIVTILPSAMGGGWLLGYYVVDRNFGSFPWGSLILTFIGAGVGFYEIIVLLSSGGGNRE